MTTGQSSTMRGQFNAQVQDSHMLKLEGGILKTIVQQYTTSIDQGDAVAVGLALQAMQVHIAVCRSWLRGIAPEALQSADGSKQGKLPFPTDAEFENSLEHSYTS